MNLSPNLWARHFSSSRCLVRQVFSSSPPPPSPPSTFPPPAISRFLTSLSIRDGRFSLISDISPSSGGLDSAPTPFDLLACALGQCSQATARLYAERKKLAISAIETLVDLKQTGQENSWLIEIKAITPFGSSLSSSDLDSLLRVSGHCPVHKALVGEGNRFQMKISQEQEKQEEKEQR